MSDRFEFSKTLCVTRHSQVDEVVDRKTGVLYVRKTLLDPKDPILRRQFMLEIEILASAFSPYAPHLVDVNESFGSLCLVEQHIPGIPLDQWLASHPSKKRRLRLVFALLDQIESLHALGFLYIDYKPANILVQDDQPHLIDFNACVPLHASTIYLSSVPIHPKQDAFEIADDLRLLHPLLRRLVSIGKHPKSSIPSLRRALRRSRLKVAAYILSVFLAAFAGLASGAPLELTVLEAYKNKQETLYSLVEKEKLDDAFWSDEKNVLFLVRETIRADDPGLSRAVFETIPPATKTRYEDEILLLEWSGMLYENLTTEKMERLVDKTSHPRHAALLLDICIQNEIYLSISRQQRMYALLAEHDPQRIVEYALFLKSRAILEIEAIEPYVDFQDPALRPLLEIWRTNT
ncbi:protein kinase domain-containing protein [uncultured Dubosiella sp.]|nr:hypothetical protein [uncultured Dubosiella sp.]